MVSLGLLLENAARTIEKLNKTLPSQCAAFSAKAGTRLVSLCPASEKTQKNGDRYRLTSDSGRFHAAIFAQKLVDQVSQPMIFGQ